MERGGGGIEREVGRGMNGKGGRRGWRGRRRVGGEPRGEVDGGKRKKMEGEGGGRGWARSFLIYI